MKSLFVGAVAALGLGSAAGASVIPVLDTITPIGPSFEFSYSGTLAGDQGLVFGSELVIFDFYGYVPGSISAGIYGPDLVAFTELTSGLPSFFGADNPLIPNLVFRWVGAPFNATGGPFADVDFAGLSARSTYGTSRIGSFSAMSVTNNGKAAGMLSFNAGFVGMPDPTSVGGGVPEPATWAMLIVGFGGAGVALRARRRLEARAS